MKKIILVVFLIGLFSCKKKESPGPAQQSIEVIVNGQKMDKVKLMEIAPVNGLSRPEKFYSINLLLADSINFYVILPLITGKDLTPPDIIASYVWGPWGTYGDITKHARITGFVDTKQYASFSGSCNLSCNDNFHPTLKINCAFTNLLYEK